MSSPVRYVVRRQESTPPNRSGVRRVLPEKWTPVATFAKAADAYAECAKLAAAARRNENPFQLGGPTLFYQTSLPAYALHDYLLDHGLTPPPTATSSNPNYVFWWVKNNRTFTDEQRAVVWQACDKLRAFEVSEEDDRRAAWLVVENEWLERQSTPDLWGGESSVYRTQVSERFQLRQACRTRREADRVRGRLADQLREESEDDGLIYFDADGQNYDWATAPFFSTRQVPATDELGGTSAFVVTRRRFAVEQAAVSRREVWEQLGYGEEWEVLSAVGDGETADRVVAEFTRKARRTVNPFALVGDEFFRPPLSTHAITDNLSDELPNGLSVEDAFAALRRLDTTPPPPASDELLADWYDRVVQWSPEFVDVIWGTFADFRLFEVVEVPLG
jgi:hypothetical protein